MAYGDLTTVAAVEAFGGIASSTAADAVIQSLITAASAFFDSYLNRTIFRADYTETRNGRGSSQLSPLHIPVVSVASCTIDGRPIIVNPAVTSPGIVFDANRIYYRGGIFCPGVQNITIVYNSGFASYAGSPLAPVGIPPDLAQACIDLVTLKFKRRTNLQMQSETLAGQTLTLFNAGDLTQGARLALDQWRDMRAVYL